MKKPQKKKETIIYKRFPDVQDPKMKREPKNCVTCKRPYKGTRYQRWCMYCRDAINNNYWEENN